jgi:hypothetical protein
MCPPSSVKSEPDQRSLGIPLTGPEPKAVSHLLSHVDVTVTMKVYAKVMCGDEAACAAAINAKMAI